MPNRNGSESAQIVWKDSLAMAFLDRRQFHPGHTLVVPRAHSEVVRKLDCDSGAVLTDTFSRLTAAVGAILPNRGLSVGHSLGEAAFQEVPRQGGRSEPFRRGGVARLTRRADRDDVLERPPVRGDGSRRRPVLRRVHGRDIHHRDRAARLCARAA